MGVKKENPKKFWTYVKSKTKARTSIPYYTWMQKKAKVSDNDYDKAEILANFYTSVFTKDNSEDLPVMEP